MPPPLRIGVVGVGYLGSLHARIYAGMRGVKLVGVVDIDAAAAARVAGECGCGGFVAREKLFGRVDAVSIAVPTEAHEEVAVDFLARGVHVLLEKPIAPDLAGGRNIVAAAEKSGAILQIGHLERFNAGVMAMAERIKDARFIESQRLGTFVERAAGTDVITDLMIHDIDIVMTMVDSEITYISAVGSPVMTRHVDIANARLEFANGAVADVTASRVSEKKFRRIRVFARDRYLALNFDDQQIEEARTAGGVGDGDGGFPRIIRERIPVPAQPPLDAELRHFTATVKKGGRPLVNGGDGIRALSVAHQVREKVAAFGGRDPRP